MAQSLKTISVKFPPEDLAVLEACAAHKHVSQSDVIRLAVWLFAESNRLLDAKGNLKKR